MMNLFKIRLMNLRGWTDNSEDGFIFQISCTDAHNLRYTLLQQVLVIYNVIKISKSIALDYTSPTQSSICHDTVLRISTIEACEYLTPSKLNSKARTTHVTD